MLYFSPLMAIISLDVDLFYRFIQLEEMSYISNCQMTKIGVNLSFNDQPIQLEMVLCEQCHYLQRNSPLGQTAIDLHYNFEFLDCAAFLVLSRVECSEPKTEDHSFLYHTSVKTRFLQHCRVIAREWRRI